MRNLHYSILSSKRRVFPSLRRSRGASMVETLIVFPVVIFLILSTIQLGMMYQAKETLGYAAFEGARIGAVNNAKPLPVTFYGPILPVPDLLYTPYPGGGGSIMSGVIQGMAPLFTYGANVGDAVKGYTTSLKEMFDHSCINYLQPYQTSFLDWAIVELQNSQRYIWMIPNDTLRYRKPLAYDSANGGQQSASTGSALTGLKGPFSSLTMQETNVLKIQLRYQYLPVIPLVNSVFLNLAYFADNLDRTFFQVVEDATTDGGTVTLDKFSKNAFDNQRIPMAAIATVRMQSPIYWNPWFPVGDTPTGVSAGVGIGSLTNVASKITGTDPSVSASYGDSILQARANAVPNGSDTSHQTDSISFCMNPDLVSAGINPAANIPTDIMTNNAEQNNEPKTNPSPGSM